MVQVCQRGKPLRPVRSGYAAELVGIFIAHRSQRVELRLRFAVNAASRSKRRVTLVRIEEVRGSNPLSSTLKIHR